MMSKKKEFNQKFLKFSTIRCLEKYRRIINNANTETVNNFIFRFLSMMRNKTEIKNKY